VVVQLYIQGQRVELFGDETISITDTIQDVRDIQKVFTSFSQSFSVPASKTNNKIFKHYYNSEITNTFDGRKKVSATIEVDYFPFKKGKLRLEGVDMRGNKAYAYRVTFFGDTVELKDKLGEKKLSDLDLNAYNTAYDATTVESKLTTEESSTNHIIAPLITHSQRLYYEDGVHGEDTGNLWYESGVGTSHHHGVKWNELKYAIRVNKIIEAIETDFDLEFSTDFFKNTSVEEFDHLFLWLHRKSGAVEDLEGSISSFETIIDGWTPVTVSKSGEPYSFVLTETTLTSNVPTFGLTSGTTPSAPTARGLTEFKVELTTTDTDAYDVVLQRDGTTVFSKTGHTGDITISADSTDTYNFDYASGSYRVIITAESTISFTNIIWFADYKVPKSTDITINATNGATGAYNTNSSFTFNISQQIPDMKIIDFLTGIFKLFNLTAYVEDDVIQVKTLDSFYSIAGGAKTYDITEFVDANQSSVDVALPFKEVSFKFKDTESFLANKFGELNNREWGSSFYDDGPDLSGSTYKIEVPFGHLLYERLNDVTYGSLKNIQWGYSVDKDQNAYLGSPLLFYPIGIFSSSIDPISFIDAVDSDNVATSHKALSDVSVNMPFNTVTTLGEFTAFQLNFNVEISEWSRDTDHDQSLFVKYYKSYIEQVFSPANRIIKIKAYLPMKILLKYTLADKFVYRNERYQINSITTNLQTGESEIELLNVVII
jgi:hypothetical protein